MQLARALDFTHRLCRQVPDAQSLASHYAAHLQICRRHLPTSYSLARTVHAHMITSGFKPRAPVLNTLVGLYVKFNKLNYAQNLFDEIPEPDVVARTTMITAHSSRGNLKRARKVFDQTPIHIRDVVCYNALISGYARNGDGHGAVVVFKDMVKCHFKPDNFTFSSLLSALRLIAEGERECEQLHSLVLKSGTDCCTSVLNALLSLYVTCASSPKVSSASLLDSARRLFDEIPEKDELTWTTMITGFVRNNDLDSAFDVFSLMSDKLPVVWNAMISGYMNGGCFTEAKQLFSEMPEKNVLTWTLMVSSLAQNGCGEEALKLLNQMKLEGFHPCDYTFAGAITACSSLGALEHGRQLHGQVVRFGYESSLSAGNALITMYSRCGVVEAAECLFLTMPFVDSISWNAMIAGLGQHGHGEEALELFEMMLEEQISPDRITYLTVLTACSHAGLVKEGQSYFNSMYSSYGITPGEDHYARMTDLLCRAGKFSDAKKLIHNMPFEPTAPVWEAFLAGCKIHGNLELGIEAAERLLELIPKHDGTYVLLSNMYADAGQWDDVARVRKMMRDRGVKKEPGCSWIEVESSVHVFLVDDTVHPEVQAVYDYLKELGLKIRELGYVPQTKYVLHNVELDQKEYSLSTHSEKLAVAYGLLKLPAGATIRVFKNLRICGDCHNAIKLISKLT
ncbi:hypothetical protein V2J09_014909 [Rumex salicifolius]